MMRGLLDGMLSVPVRGSFAVKLLLTLSQKHLPAHDQRGHHQNADYQTKRRDNRNVAEKRERFALGRRGILARADNVDLPTNECRPLNAES